MTISAPSARHIDTGTGLTRPPSTSTAPSRTTGVKSPGIAHEARTTSSRLPWRSQISRPESSSVATAPYGIGRLVDVAVLEDGAKEREQPLAADQAAASR